MRKILKLKETGWIKEEKMKSPKTLTGKSAFFKNWRLNFVKKKKKTMQRRSLTRLFWNYCISRNPSDWSRGLSMQGDGPVAINLKDKP